MNRLKDVVIDVNGMRGSWRQKKMMSVRLEMLTIWRSNLFMKMILEMPDKYRRGESKSSIFKNKNNNQIYEILMQSKEETSTEKDFIMQLYVRSYLSMKRVIGYMNPFSKWIYVNEKYFDNFSRKKVGSNGSHEHTHCLGGRHSGNDFMLSLMYYINYTYETCYEHFFEKNLPDIDYNPPGSEDYDTRPVQVPTVPKPEPRKYRVQCSWWGKNLFRFRKTCYRIYDV